MSGTYVQAPRLSESQELMRCFAPIALWKEIDPPLELEEFMDRRSAWRLVRLHDIYTEANIQGAALSVPDALIEQACSVTTEEIEVYARALASVPYADYLCLDEWHDVRALTFARFDNCCALCVKGDQLDVHHRTYERRGWEYAADLTLLCRRCHGRHHGRSA